jgi:glycosyltransferase involved in cell wall biosynthesis
MISAVVYISQDDYSYNETLDSLNQQAFKDKEVIAVCDACSLETLQSIKSKADKVIAFKNPKGKAVAKNMGAERAEGDVLIFINAGAQLSPEVFSDIHNTKENWVIGTCRVESPDDEAGYHEVFEFKNKFLVPKGEHNGVVYCKTLTFNVLGKYNGGFEDENKDLIKRFKKQGKFHVTEAPIYANAKEFVGKSSFKAKMSALKGFMRRNK